MKKFGDRRDGKRLKDLNGMNYIMYHIKKKRSESEVYINYSIDVTELVKYINELDRKKKHITYFHAFSTAVAKVFYNRPYLNRFIVNGHFYERNEVLLAFAQKTQFNDDAKEFMQIFKVNKDDNIFSISERMSKKVQTVRSNKGSGTDDLVAKIGKMPRPIRGFVVSIFKFLDKHDLVPRSMTKEILYYSSVILSNIGSIGCKDAIYHNITDFGTNSVLATIGKIYKKEIINDKGKKEIRDFCDFGITLDERIADGFYFIKSVQLLEYILGNPKLLEGRCDDKIK